MKRKKKFLFELLYFILFIYLFINLFIFLFTYLFIYLFIYFYSLIFFYFMFLFFVVFPVTFLGHHTSVSHPLELRKISYLTFYNFTVNFILFLSYQICSFVLFRLIRFVCFLFFLYYVPYYVPQILIKWGIGRRVGGNSIFQQLTGEKKSSSITCFYDKNIIL